MNLYLAQIFNSKNAKKHFLIDIIQGDTDTQAINTTINKKYFKDSGQRNILGTCKKVEILHKIK